MYERTDKERNDLINKQREEQRINTHTKVNERQRKRREYERRDRQTND